MGKIRVKTFGDEEQELKEKEKLEKKKQAKINAAKSQNNDNAEDESDEKEEIKEADTTKEPKTETQQLETELNEDQPAKVKTEIPKKEKSESKKEIFHSAKYQALSDSFDKTKAYSLSEGLDILEKIQRKVFDETVELHINTVSSGISGNVVLPNGTGKKIKVVIATDAVIAEIEKGKIDFDILLAEPTMMGKLAKVAKVLGPKGLMPNPKNGTITTNPTDAAKKYEGGQVNFKTESKSPIMHLTVGKMSFGKTKLTENIEEFIKAVKKSNIVNITLKSTMSPGIKIKV